MTFSALVVSSTKATSAVTKAIAMMPTGERKAGSVSNSLIAGIYARHRRHLQDMPIRAA